MILPEPTPLVLPRPEDFTRDGISRVETTTLLPGGALLTLTLRRTGERFSVDDEAGGHAAVLALGLRNLTGAEARRGSDIARRSGLAYVERVFLLKEVPPEQLAAAIACVAEASRAWTVATVEAHRRPSRRELVARLSDRLRRSFPGRDVEVERELSGASGKLHRFDVVVSLPRERFAVFETLLPVASSIAAAHLKFYDLAQAHPDWPREAVVNDLSEWASEDLAVIRKVATGVHAIEAEWNDLSASAARS